MSLLLPVHPVTGLRAIGMTRRGPVWPVIGASPDHDGSADGDGNGNGDGDGGSQSGQQQPGAPDKGFPENTPIAEMTVEQQLAYFKHHDRRKAGLLKQFDGTTPDDVKSLRERVAELERDQLSASEKAVADAQAQAAQAAAAAESARWAPQLMKAIVAGSGLSQAQQDAFLDIVDAGKFLTDSGEFDHDGLAAKLATFAPAKKTTTSWGQHDQGHPPNSDGAALGLAEAHKRFGKPQPS